MNLILEIPLNIFFHYLNYNNLNGLIIVLIVSEWFLKKEKYGLLQ